MYKEWNLQYIDQKLVVCILNKYTIYTFFPNIIKNVNKEIIYFIYILLSRYKKYY